MKTSNQYEAIVIGTSAGGLTALTTILRMLPETYTVPILLVQHRARNSPALFEDVLQNKCQLAIKQADEKEAIRPGRVYVAPPDYHMLVEADRTISLSVEPPVQYSRPSIDVLFESAAMAYRDKLVGIILSGSNSDGAAGIRTINTLGGLAIAQNPKEAQYPFMPQAAIDTGAVHVVWGLEEIGGFLGAGCWVLGSRF